MNDVSWIGMDFAEDSRRTYDRLRTRRHVEDIWDRYREMVDVTDRPPPTPEKPKAKAKTPKPQKVEARNDTAAYEDLCAELGFAPTDVEKNRVHRAFKSKRIPIYDPGEVAAYMTSITPKGMHWGWKGLLHSKKGASEYLGSDGGFIAGQYDKLVPMHILKRVKVVKELFANDEPKFYVTDYAVKDPDPFVKVVLKSGEEVIFGMWDEPGFGDLKTEV